MVNLFIQNTSYLSYEIFRDFVCSYLVGNRGYVENDIVVSDEYQYKNILLISLGSDDSLEMNIRTTIDNIDFLLPPNPSGKDRINDIEMAHEFHEIHEIKKYKDLYRDIGDNCREAAADKEDINNG